MTISAIVSSATLRVFEKGALNTGTPARLAETRSTWLVPTEKQPMAMSRSAACRMSGVIWVRDRMPRRWMPRMALARAAPSSALGSLWMLL